MAKILGLPNFVVHSMGEWGNKLKPHVNGICNTDDIGGPGIHWIGYHNDPNSRYVYYWDSFGAPINPRLKKYLNTSGKQIIAVNSHTQNLKAESCGQWCLYFLHTMEYGDIFDLLSKINVLDQDENERNLELFFKEHVYK